MRMRTATRAAPAHAFLPGFAFNQLHDFLTDFAFNQLQGAALVAVRRLVSSANSVNKAVRRLVSSANSILL